MHFEWVKVSQELPPCDGTYEITNLPQTRDHWIKRELTGTAYYDGWGFQYLGVYRDPEYWRRIPERKAKKYGRIE